MKNHKHHTLLGVFVAFAGVLFAMIEPMLGAALAAGGGALFGQGITHRKFDPQDHRNEGK